MDKKSIHSVVREVVEQNKSVIFDISDYIFEHPELGDEEYLSSAYLKKVLESYGFSVEMPYKGLETAFRAELITGDGPTLGFLAEYDALPGFGPEKENGHACGHNWIAATCAGTGIVLSELEEYFSGTIVIFGTPAEETTGRKVDLTDAGAFDDVDAVFQMHLYQNSNLKARALAINSYEFVFTGKASHAAVSPEEGVNALDAVMLTFAGINCLRQQLKSDVRIHGIVTEGGEASNIIPDRCKCYFDVRAAKLSYLKNVSKKVENCANGAAMMTGANLQINGPMSTYYDLRLNPVLLKEMEEHMLEAGFEPLDQEEEIPGSTDIGNVSYACPTLYGNVGIANGEVLVHEEKFLQVANSTEAKERLLMVVECFASIAIELSKDTKLMNDVKKAFDNASSEE